MKLSKSHYFYTYNIIFWQHLISGSPDGLHGQSDECGDGVSYGEMIHQIVDISLRTKPNYQYEILKKIKENFTLHLSWLEFSPYCVPRNSKSYQLELHDLHLHLDV